MTAGRFEIRKRSVSWACFHRLSLIIPYAVRMRFPLLLFATFGVGHSALAAEFPRSYSWAQCVTITKESNGELRAAEASFRAAKALEGSAESGFYPSLSGTLSATKNSTTSTANGAFGGSSISRNTYAASLSASQNLFAGFHDLGKKRQAEANTRAAEAALDLVRARISYDLKSNYEGVLYAVENVKLTQEILKRREDNRRLVELRFESGRENKGSVLLSEAYRNQARYENGVATNSIESARSLLAKTLGLDGDAPITISELIPVTDPPSAELGWIQLALSTPEHRQSAAQENAAEEAITVTRATFFPSLNLSGSVGRQDQEFFPGNPRWSIGLSLNFPLFNGFRDLSSFRNSVENSTVASQNRMNIDRDLIAKLKQARNGFAEAFEKLLVDGSFRDAAQTRAEIARNKYNNGLLTFDDWDVIESDLISRQKIYLQSKRDRLVKEATWEQIQGKGVLR